MKREVVQDFLNLPGITGVALINGRSRPYFYRLADSLNFQQREALTQGIQQVVDTTPEHFKFFQFQFSGYQAYIYKLEHGMILLVLATDQLDISAYEQSVERLRLELVTNQINAIAVFRSLAGNTLSNLQDSPAAPSFSTLQVPPPQPAGLPQQPHLNRSTAPLLTDPSDVQPEIKLGEVVAALNQLSGFTTQYLGTSVVANYWKSTRPDAPWLNQFHIERSAQFAAHEPLPTSLSAEQQQWIQSWVSAFIQRCSRVIRDFPQIVEQQALSDQQKPLLLPPKP